MMEYEKALEIMATAHAMAKVKGVASEALPTYRKAVAVVYEHLCEGAGG